MKANWYTLRAIAEAAAATGPGWEDDQRIFAVSVTPTRVLQLLNELEGAHRIIEAVRKALPEDDGSLA